MAAKKKQVKIIVRTVSFGKFHDPAAKLFSADEVEDYVSEFINSGEWELMGQPVFLGYEGYMENDPSESGVRYSFILKPVQK